MIVIICCSILLIFWIVSTNRKRRKFVQLLILIAGIFIVLTSPMFANLLMWGLTIPLPADSGTTVDAIIILGRGPDTQDDRIATAWELWQTERAPMIFLSGMLDAEQMLKYLQVNEISGVSLLGERCSQTTEENAAFSSAILHSSGVEDILLVTDPPHMWRAFLVFRSFGFNVIPHATITTNQTSSTGKQLFVIVREYTALAQYALTNKFRKRLPAELDTPSPEILAKITEWNCKISKQEYIK